jgi:hypothetical protein
MKIVIAVSPSSTDDQEHFHATNSAGNISSHKALFIFDEASAGMQAFVSNLSPHFVQDQRLTTKRSLTNSDQSGAISISPHLAQIVVMAFSFAYSCSPLQWGVFGIATVASSRRRSALIQIKKPSWQH